MADDIVERLSDMSQWLWSTEQELERNNNARAALAEITRLRAGGCSRDQGLTQYCAEAAKFAAEIAELRAEVERLRALTTWRPIDESPHAVRPVPIDLYHELFGRIPDCYWHQFHGWVRIARGDRGYAPIEHPNLLTHYMLKPLPPAPESSDA